MFLVLFSDKFIFIPKGIRLTVSVSVSRKPCSISQGSFTSPVTGNGISVVTQLIVLYRVTRVITRGTVWSRRPAADKHEINTWPRCHARDMYKFYSIGRLIVPRENCRWACAFEFWLWNAIIRNVHSHRVISRPRAWITSMELRPDRGKCAECFKIYLVKC